MKNTITINGDNYTLKAGKVFKNYKSDLYELYKSPSYEKVKAFNYRKGKLNCIYGLIGNRHLFTIYGSIIDNEGVEHNVKITKSNNYILY